MTNRRDWQIAFLKQARIDWEAYQRARQTRWPDCLQLHFLQMATEKLGKVLLFAGHSKLERLTRSHAAFVKFIYFSADNVTSNLAWRQAAQGYRKLYHRV